MCSVFYGPDVTLSRGYLIVMSGKCKESIKHSIVQCWCARLVPTTSNHKHSVHNALRQREFPYDISTLVHIGPNKHSVHNALRQRESPYDISTLVHIGPNKHSVHNALRQREFPYDIITLGLPQPKLGNFLSLEEQNRTEQDSCIIRAKKHGSANLRWVHLYYVSCLFFKK